MVKKKPTTTSARTIRPACALSHEEFRELENFWHGFTQTLEIFRLAGLEPWDNAYCVLEPFREKLNRLMVELTERRPR